MKKILMLVALVVALCPMIVQAGNLTYSDIQYFYPLVKVSDYNGKILAQRIGEPNVALVSNCFMKCITSGGTPRMCEMIIEKQGVRENNALCADLTDDNVATYLELRREVLGY